MTNVFLLVVTLLGGSVFLSLLSIRSKLVDKLLNDVPILLVVNGKLERGAGEEDACNRGRHLGARLSPKSHPGGRRFESG